VLAHGCLPVVSRVPEEGGRGGETASRWSVLAARRLLMGGSRWEGCLGVPEALGGGETWRELQDDFYSWCGQNVGFPAVHLMDHVMQEFSSICFSDARNQTFLQVSSAFVLLTNLKAQAMFRPTNQA